MDTSGQCQQLPENHSIKDINAFKKQINWGELPAFYHLVAQSLGESEGVLSHGFDNAAKRIIDQRNWNLTVLGGYVDNANMIHCENKPRIALYQRFTARGFELQALPYAKESEIDQYVKGNRLMEFLLWDPVSMRLVLRINQLQQFISFYFEHGDDVDFALIQHAHQTVDKVIMFLRQQVNIVKVDGVSIRSFYAQQKKALGYADEDALQLSAAEAGLSEYKNQ
jgi:hypothetical protein